MTYVHAVWNWLNGRKTTIGAIGLFLTHGALGMGWLPADIGAKILAFFMAWTAGGLTHKGYKKFA